MASYVSAQSYPTLCDPADYSPPGSSVHGDSPGKNTGGGCHALLWGNLLNPGIEPMSLASPALAGGFLAASAAWKPDCVFVFYLFLLLEIFK